MSAEHVGDRVFISYGDRDEPAPASQQHPADQGVILKISDTASEDGSRQCQEDEAVVAELRRLVLTRLPDDGSVQVLLCDNPGGAGVPYEALAAAMVEAYGKAGIGKRAEGMEHFENGRMYRGYEGHGHGPARFVIIRDSAGAIWVFCDYFAVYDDHKLLGEPYASVTAQWKQRTGLRPGEHVMSKLVNTHNLITDQQRSRVAAGLGARVFASIVQGLANAHEQGMLLAGNAQAGTRNFVLGRLRSLLTGQLEVVFDGVGEARDGEPLQAQMVIHVLPATVKE